MKKKVLLDSLDRTRIASSLYKLAIRVMQLSKRPLDPVQVSAALNAASKGKITKLIEFFSSAKNQGSLKIVKPPAIQKVLATRTNVPEQGEGIRVDLICGPFFLLENSDKELGVISKNTVIRPGLPPDNLFSLESLYQTADKVFGGILSQHKLPVVDARDVSDKPYAIDHSYDKLVGDKAWKVIHTTGPKKGQVALYENPKIKEQMKGESELDPWVPAVFSNGADASRVLNQLTRGTSYSSRSFPKFREYTTFLKYSSVHLKNPADGNVSLYNVFDTLLSSADEVSDTAASEEAKAIVTQALEWLREKSVNPATLMATLENKNPEMAKKLKTVLPEIEEAWSREQDVSQESTVRKLISLLNENKLVPENLLGSLNVKNPGILRDVNKILPSSNIAALTDKVTKLLPSLERAWARQSVKEAV